jgi:NADPH:quinone reductase-like Zn-dependent oxidoreductase
MEFVRGLGADQAIDHNSQRFEDAVGQGEIDLVFDLVDGETQERSWAVLKQGGTMISTLSKPSEAQARAHAARAENFVVQPNGAELNEIGRLIDAGKLRPHVEAVFPLAAVRTAQQQLERKHIRGKIVLEIGS